MDASPGSLVSQTFVPAEENVESAQVLSIEFSHENSRVPLRPTRGPQLLF